MIISPVVDHAGANQGGHQGSPLPVTVRILTMIIGGSVSGSAARA